MTRRIIVAMLVIVATLFVFVGCSGCTIEGGDVKITYENDKAGKVVGEYQMMDGEKDFAIRVPEDKSTVKFVFAHNTKSGSLKIDIIARNGDIIPIATTEPIFGGEKPVFIYEKGNQKNIKIRVIAENHSGGFTLDYVS